MRPARRRQSAEHRSPVSIMSFNNNPLLVDMGGPDDVVARTTTISTSIANSPQPSAQRETGNSPVHQLTTG